MDEWVGKYWYVDGDGCGLCRLHLTYLERGKKKASLDVEGAVVT